MFLIDKWLVALVSPLGTALFLGLLACILGLSQRKRGALLFGLGAWCWLLVWSMPIASDALYNWVTRDYPPVSISTLQPADAIVLLGGGINPADSLNPEADLNLAADRMVMAAKLFHAGKAQKIILTGGLESTYLTSEAQAMADMLVLRGVPKSALILEQSSRNTRENALMTFRALDGAGVKRAFLVTSALHMRRAMGDFANRQITFVPVATDYEARARPTWRRWVPDTRALDMSARAFKETAAWLLQVVKKLI
jgi:uncharacterized SAM-binding protein YcdF (DUF218 family)